MKCPSCGYLQRSEGRADCEACGLIFAKWQAAHTGVKPAGAAPVPESLEIHGNIYTGYFWYDFFLREFFWVITLFSLMLINWRQPRNPYWLLIPVSILGLYFLLYLVLWIPRKMAVLTRGGVEFASPIGWALFFPKWYKAHWSDVVRVRSARRFPFAKTPYVYHVIVEVRVPGEEGIKTFGVRALNGKYGDFLKYLAAQVDPLKMDEDIKVILKPDNLEGYLSYQARGMKTGLIWGAILAALYLYFWNDIYRSRWAGVPVMVWIAIPVGLLLGWANKFFVKPPPDFKK